MKQKRRERISSSLRAEIAEIIQRDLRDPRLGFISVTRVEPTEDLKEAVVHVSILGSEGQQRTSLRGLRAAAGFIQGLLADRIRLRNTPVLRFELDESIRKHMELEDLLKRARGESAPRDEEEE
ncbi:MAG: 30S ribosome-binding factor RbfA [Planctomycetota bacterium]